MKRLNLRDARQVLVVFGLVMGIVALLSLALPARTEAAPPQQGPGYYYVQWGDTLFSISRRYGTTVPALMLANGLASDYIFAGQRLVIPVGFPGTPPPPPTGFTCAYAVQWKDTIYSIAWRYSVPWYSLMQANYMYSPYLYVGMPLKVPCTTPTTFPVYTVQSYDNLFRIAISYSTSIYAIALVNRLPNPNLIFVGQNLIIPYSGTVQYPPNIPTRVPPSVTLTATPTGTPSTVTPTPTATATITPTGQSAVVIMTNLTFIPNSLTISRGTTVLWQNSESVTHTVTSGVPGTIDNKFRSGQLGAGQTFSFVFTNPGTYPYFSELDSGMTGTIVVQ